jgi:hypothetical protein
MILPDVDHYRVVEPMYEGIRVILSYRGETYSPAYVQGISGAAFHVGGICPCAPTCTEGIEPIELVRKFGYQVEAIPLFNETVSADQRAPDDLMDSLIERIKAEIRANHPVLVWHAFTNAEWDVVAGYDDSAGADHRRLFLGRGSYAWLDGYAEASQTRPRDAIEICPAFGAIFLGEKIGKFDTQSAEIASLSEVVAHAHSQKNANKLGGNDWVFLQGFLAYERWVNDFRNPQKTRTAGDAYCYGVYRSTHRAASDYLAELSINYPQARNSLLEASRLFALEAEILSKGEPLLWWSSPEGPDPARNQQATALLAQSFSSYHRGIDSIEQALGKMM